MSDSRLEKFIYAICSMDVTDLPVPLSRIEKLWNCLITGETPDFEPLSRNEKYLMAMLDRYDISNLPAPMSRGEKLLYKIAVGETDLSDVPGYLSRYEELLKYLIENSGISGGDFEYVLYTLNQSLNTLYTTAEKPVKSAILSGNTLVNVNIGFTSTWGGIIVSQSEVSSIGRTTTTWDFDKALLKSNTVYLITYNCNTNLTKDIDRGISVYCVGGTSGYSTFTNGLNSFTFTTGDLSVDSNRVYLGIQLGTGNESDVVISNIMIIEYQDGMEKWDIPYFEGMQSVKMPVLTTSTFIPMYSFLKDDGKENFTKLYTEFYEVTKDTFTFKQSGHYQRIGITTDNFKKEGKQTLERNKEYQFKIEILENTLSIDMEIQCRPKYTDGLTRIVGAGKTPIYEFSKTITSEIPEDDVHGSGEMILFHLPSGYNGEVSFKVTIGEGNVNNIKTNILTVNEEVELGSVGEVKDELNLLTGQLTQRTETRAYQEGDESNSEVLTDMTNTRYKLPKEVIKTVDLTVFNQDNQPTKLGTFENLTYVSLESAGLIPEVEMEVATNLLEDTVFTLTNAFNTLYPTAAKSVVDGTLYGQTLVNIHPAEYTISRASDTTYYIGKDMPKKLIKPSTRYFLRLYNTHQSIIRAYFKPCINNTVDLISSDNKCAIFTTKSEFTDSDFGNNKIHFYSSSAITLDDVKDTKIILCEYQDGMENWDIPYFTGMQSVQMPVLTTSNLGNLLKREQLQKGMFKNDNGVVIPTVDMIVSDFIVREFDEYTLSHSGSWCWTKIFEYDGEKVFIQYSETRGDSHTAILNGRTKFIRIAIEHSFSLADTLDIKLCPYASRNSQPYKSNILSTPSDLELRGIGDVQDTLDCLTGEVVERIGEIVLNGNSDETWVSKRNITINNIEYEQYYLVSHPISEKNNSGATSLPNIISDKGTTDPFDGLWSGGSIKTISVRESDGLYYFCMNFPKNEDIKEWLSQNPITICYHLETESIKTVDLTVIDQDGNETKLRTFDDTTHVLLNSEGLIPTASLTVRTKIPSASSTSLLMDELSTEQQQLETTVDEQSENVDATMIATTEIYEETL